MFIILTLALLPLGLVALFASLQASRAADLERAALLDVAAMQSARKLTTEIASDQSVLRMLVNTLPMGINRAGDICARTRTVINESSSESVTFAVYGRNGRQLCASNATVVEGMPPAQRFRNRPADLFPAEGVLLYRTFSTDGARVAITRYDMAFLHASTSPSNAQQNPHVALRQGANILHVTEPRDPPSPTRAMSATAPVADTGVSLVMTVSDPPMTIARGLSLFLPLVMWFAAAAIGWYMVNWLLIRPLTQLRTQVSAYRPGEVIEPLIKMRTPAHEILELGDTFRAISQDVATHEAEMAAGLERQTRLTREVHHRVKNNLQIIASLINLHSRAAPTIEAADAYASIQRRVDALSVVHRNHYAELEDNRGVGIRSLVSELSASLRATAPNTAPDFGIEVDSDNLHVSQDVALPIAFLIAELVEMALLIAPASTVRIAVRALPDMPGRAEIEVMSGAYCASDLLDDYLRTRFGRVLTGLSRQLRAPLEYDGELGRYAIALTVQD